MTYGYARCSTTETKQDIERQKRELKAMGAEEIYFEYESATKIHRAELEKLLKHIQPGDTLMTTEISRITRSTKQLCEIVEFAIQNNIKLVIGGFIADCTGGIDPMTEGMIKMMGVFAEMERNMIAERVKSGLANARAKGVRIGRPQVTVKSLPRRFSEYYEMYKSGQINKTELAKICGVSKPTIYKYIAVYTDR